MKLDFLGYALPLLVVALPFAFAHDNNRAAHQPQLAKEAECEQALANKDLVINVTYADVKGARDDIKAFCRS